ncbi:MAG: alpha/beta fold hydrolase [Gammaproteobacteria bacterium]
MKERPINPIQNPGFTTAAVLLLSMMTASPAPAASGASQQEQFWAEQIGRRIDREQITWLEKDDMKFLALYRQESSGNQEGAAIILHGAGTHPAWPEVVDPLRLRLPEHGWSTLSLQMPLTGMADQAAEQPALSEEVAGRITAAIAFLNNNGVTNIVLIGYGLGALMALDYVERQGDGISAMVSISPYGGKLLGEPRSPPSFKTAMLELYGERDLPAVLKNVARRSLAARRAGLGHSSQRPDTMQTRLAPAPPAWDIYRLQLISGADHGFHGYEDLLVKRLLGWLRRHAPSISITRHS